MCFEKTQHVMEIERREMDDRKENVKINNIYKKNTQETDYTMTL